MNTKLTAAESAKLILPKNPRFEAYKDRKSEWRWRLRAANGLIIADSAEGYAKHGNAIRAAETVRGLLRHSGAPIPIVHWEAGQKDVGGRRPKVALGPRAAGLAAGSSDPEPYVPFGHARIKRAPGL